MSSAPRKFESSPARRSKVPLLIGIAGMAGSGKTFSALRLARGIAPIVGGHVAGLDTETMRMLHYAHDSNCKIDSSGRCKNPGHFEFRHMPFSPPYSPIHYVDGVRQAIQEGAGVVVIDSASDMHEGLGGMLMQKEDLLDRWCGDNKDARDKATARAWNKVKGELKETILMLMQLNSVVIFCFRARDKRDWGNKVTELGTMAIADDSLIYSMTAQALLEPGADGVPNWEPPLKGERMQTKRGPFRDLLASTSGPFSEEMGAIMGRWAMGDTSAPAASTARAAQPVDREPKRDPGPTSTGDGPLSAILSRVASASTAAEVSAIGREIADQAEAWSDDQKTQARAAIRARNRELQT